MNTPKSKEVYTTAQLTELLDKTIQAVINCTNILVKEQEIVELLKNRINKLEKKIK